MAAVRREIDVRGTVVMPPVTDFLDLVALGTVADLVPLDVNNRVLVSQGIRRIRAGRAVPGIRALLEIGKRIGRDAHRCRSRFHHRSATERRRPAR